MNDDFYMHLALNEAWKYQFLTYPNPAVGCVILDKNKQILSLAAHEEAGKAHAELNAISQALSKLNPALNVPQEPNLAHEFIIKHHKNLLENATAYVTLEPCAHQGKTPPCAKLLSALKFKEVTISVKDEHALASGGAQMLTQAGVKVKIGVLENEGKALLKPFLKWQKGAFKFFKLALSLNGSPLGKEISNKLSRTYAHKIRSKLDLLVIGANTVRADRPILDARLAGKNAKAPDICILSRSLSALNLASKPLNLEYLSTFFDLQIPLFKVPERRIYSHIPKEAKFIMYEGGANFLRHFAHEMDMFLIFSNSKFQDAPNAALDLALRPLYKGFLGEDTYGIYEL